VGAAPEPALSEAERAQLARGVAEFNGGYLFECHETLEDLWTGLRGPGRDFLQGLIQVAVAFYHLGNGNREGFSSLVGRALRRWAPYPDRYLGFDLAAYRAELARWQSRLAAGEAGALDAAARPHWRFEGLSLPPA
jgi:predicted metal-dependent hydrolase